jgi:DNA-3-methyladenine glycosylase
VDFPLPAPPPPARRRLLRLASLPLREMLAGDVAVAAAGLLGCVLVRILPDGTERRALLVETEAYHMREPGSHAYRGKTPRNAVMFGPPGRAYVYFTYGMWHCANVVCEPEGCAAAVLLRAAVDVSAGAGQARPPRSPGGQGRATSAPPQAPTPLRLSGPGLLCHGLEITREQSGLDLLDVASPLRLERPAGWQLPPVDWTTRIGFSFPDIYPWRAVWRGHPAVSPGRPGVVLKRQRK